MPLREPRDGYTAVGVVVRPHGLRGELRLHAFAEGAPNLQRGCRVHLRGEAHVVLRARPDRGAWIVQFSGIGDRSQAEEMRGEIAEVADAEVRRNDAESYFVYELVGLRVERPGGEVLGTLTEVLQTGANDVYVVRGPRGEFLAPAIGAVIGQIDLAKGIVVMTPLAEMLDDSQ